MADENREYEHDEGEIVDSRHIESGRRKSRNKGHGDTHVKRQGSVHRWCIQS